MTWHRRSFIPLDDEADETTKSIKNEDKQLNCIGRQLRNGLRVKRTRGQVTTANQRTLVVKMAA